MPDTFSTFKSKIKSLVHPGGMAKTLEYQFGEDVVQALIDLQRWIPGLKKRNRDVYPFCSTYFACGATVIPKPRGKIQRVYTLQGNCCPILYDYEPSYDRFINWLNYNRKAWTEPVNEGMPPLPEPFKFAEDVTDKGYRYNYGFYTIKGDQIWIGHRIESTESVVVEWEGVRRKYSDDTIMPYDDATEGDVNDMGTELRSAVAAFVRAEDFRKNRRAMEDAAIEMQVYRDQRADMKHEDWNESEPELIELHSDGGFQFDQLVTTPCGYDTECNPEEEGDETIVFANIADFGDGGSDMQDVAELVNDWEPDWVTTNGDNWYGDSLEPSDFEAKALKWYRNFIYPYLSFEDPKLTTSALVNRFFPCIGDHDRDPVGRLQMVLSLCNVPKVLRGNQLVRSTGYYSVRPLNGFVEHFFYDNGYDSDEVLVQDDGNDLNSIQAVWLQTALARSTARWKIVHCGVTGYTSATTPKTDDCFVGDGTRAYAAIRNITNKLKAWGADLMLCGDIHCYERLNVMGLPLINNGSGGRPIQGLGTAIPFSVVRDTTNFGAGRCTATCETLTWEFISKSGVVLDELVLNKPR